MVRPKVDMIGRTFGRLTVVEQTEGKQKDRQAWYLGRCQRGNRIDCELWMSAGRHDAEKK